MNVLLIGPPGSGKGTQGERLAKRWGLQHLAAGDILRAEVAAGTELGRSVAQYMSRGELIPDSVIVDLMLPATLAAARNGGYLLDGFPRSMDQAMEARRLTESADSPADLVVYLDAPHKVLTKRLLERAKIEGRADDTADVIENRLRIFEDETRPLVQYYTERGLLHHFDATQSPDDLADEISAVIEQIQQKKQA